MKYVCLALCLGLSVFAQEDDNTDRTVLVTRGQDDSIRLVMKGRAGNLELKRSETAHEGEVVTDYQKGRGFVSYDRTLQTLQWRSKINFTLNRMAGFIRKRAPYMRAEIPRGSDVDFDMRINSMGYGSLDFSDLDVTDFRLKVQYGDVDVAFPTKNRAIVRDRVIFGLTAGDLEVYDLGNLNATDIKINGGVGELFVDVGPKILQNTELRLDMDIGSLELVIPRGTHVRIRGTNRNLTAFGFEKVDKVWIPTEYSERSPLLDIKMTGPLGDLSIAWKD